MQSGKRQHPKQRRAMGISGVMTYYSDPPGMRRVADAGAGPDMWHMMPTAPAFPVMGAYVNFWQFIKEADVDPANTLVEKYDNEGTGLALQDKRGGFAKVTTDTGDNDYYYYMSKSEIGRLIGGKDLWFKTHLIIGDVDQADWFIGLSKRLTAADALFDARNDCIGFYGLDGSAAIGCECTKDGTSTQDITGNGNLVDNTAVELGFHVFSTTQVQFYVNNRYVCTILSNLPDDEEMCFAFGIRNGQAAANTLEVATTYLIQET